MMAVFEQEPQFTPSVSRFETFFITSVQLSLVTQERFDFRTAFAFAGT